MFPYRVDDLWLLRVLQGFQGLGDISGGVYGVFVSCAFPVVFEGFLRYLFTVNF